jgi:glycerophosphoryl diester phosphodiesterase
MRNRSKQQREALKEGFDTGKKIIDALKRSFVPLVATSVIYHILAFTILTPLISGYAGLFYARSGRLIVANEEIAGFLLQPIGFLALLTIAACSLTLIALEQACLMAILIQEDANDTKSRVIGAFKYVSQRIIAIHNLALRIVFRVLLTIAPFAVLAGLLYHMLLSEHDINYYLTSKPTEFKVALAGGIILAVGLVITLIRYAVRVIFSLPILMFEDKKPADALRESTLKAEHRKLLITMGAGGWGLSVVAVSSLSAAAFIWVGRLSVPFLLGHTVYLVPVIGLLFLGLTVCQFIVSIAATASFSSLVMILYGISNPLLGELNLKQTGGINGRTNQNARASGTRMIVGAVVFFIVASITGFLLLSRADIEDRTEIVAHRGASGSAPENTMSAIEHAISGGAHWVEIDVQRSADDRVVVVHDRDLVRIGNVPLVVSQTPYAQLAQIDVGSWFDPRFSDQRIPTLEDVLERCKSKIKVNIELKYYAWDPHLAGRVIALVEKFRMQSEVVVMSLRPQALEQVKRERPDWQVGLLAAATLTDLAGVDVNFLAVHSKMVNPGFVRRIHRNGKTIQVWTVNDTVGMTKMFGMGVDALITDEPVRAVQLLAQRAGMNPMERMLVTAGLLVVGDQEHIDPSTDGL